MRILLVSNLFPPYWVGGYEQIAGWTRRGLIARGHEVKVLTGRGAAFASEPGIVPWLDLDLEGFRDAYFGSGFDDGRSLRHAIRTFVFHPGNYRATQAAIATIRPDLVAIWNTARVTFAPLLAARSCRVPSVLHLSDTVVNPFRNPHPPDWPSSPFFPVSLARAAVDTVIALSRPACAVTPSRFLMDKFVRTENLRSTRREVLRWPIEPTISKIDPPPRPAGLCRRFLFSGSVIPEKGVDVLVRSFRQAARRAPGLRLTIAGDGPRIFGERIREEAHGLDIVFAGRCDRREVIRHLREHDAFVFPSVWDEPYAVAPLEAMAMSLPVIATRRGGTPEAIAHGETGLLVEAGDEGSLADAIVRLSSEVGLAERLGENGCRSVRSSASFEAFLTRLEELYEDLRA